MLPDPRQLVLPLEEEHTGASGREWPAVGTAIRVWRRFRRLPWPGAPVEEVLQVHTGVLQAVVPAGVDPKEMRRANAAVDRVFGLGARKSKYDRLILKRFRFGASKMQEVVVTYNPAESTWMTMEQAEGGRHTNRRWPIRSRR